MINERAFLKRSCKERPLVQCGGLPSRTFVPNMLAAPDKFVPSSTRRGFKATGTLRVSREGELDGLDLHEHGMLAYPEYVIHGDIHTHHTGSSVPSAMAVPMPVPHEAK